MSSNVWALTTTGDGHCRMRNARLYVAFPGFCLLLLATSRAFAAEDVSTEQLLAMSLAELANVEVTSVSKTSEKANEAAAAVFVITNEDMKRSGATTLPEALRMVPGVHVAQAGSHDWAVSVRGFNSQFANKLLVLIDGRTVYNPMFSGTFWEVQDTLLEDIDRIEVIRGPGAAQWGANAVNGVISIITKSAMDTQGGFATASRGINVRSDSGVRYGIKVANDSYARVYAKYSDHGPQRNVGSGHSNDDWQKRQAGFRSDSTLSHIDSLTIQGDVYDAQERLTLNLPSLSPPYLLVTPGETLASGGNVLARWTRKASLESTATTQLYVDKTRHANGYVHYNTTTADIDFQHIWTGWEGHEVVWGTGYRLIEDHEGATPVFELLPMNRRDSVYSAFLQDKITLHADDLFLTLGSKFEHNDYTGFEIQPSARLSWLISDQQMAWGSVSRAVHPANRFTDNAQMMVGVVPPGVPSNPFGVPIRLQVQGNQSLDAEALTAYELGYRIRPTRFVSLDIAAFYNDYHHLFYGTNGTGVLAGGGTYYLQPIYAANSNSANSKGFEISAKLDATKNWQISSSYSYLDLVMDKKFDPAFSFSNNPKHQFSARSTYLFPSNTEMTNTLYYVSGLAPAGIPGYYRFDVKLSHEIMTGMQASLVGQNLLRPQHKEFPGFLYQDPVEIGRSVYGNITWKF